MSDIPYQPQAASQTPSPPTGLAPIIVQRLHEFRQRRLQLRAQRGAFWSWTVFVACVLAGTLLDRLLDDNWVPWAVCLTIYGLTLAAVYLGCFRPYLAPHDLAGEASAIEAQEPSLRDLLLSAVELSDRPANAFDSAAFRQQLQVQVARSMEPLAMRRLGSYDRVQRARLGALLVSGLFALLCLVPGLHLPLRSARCLLPWMDFGRVSQFAIWFEQPSPRAQRLPQGDLVAFTACVSGQPQTVWLETRSADRQQRLAMLPMATSDKPEEVDGAQRFGASMPIESSALEYRAVAEGSRTPWYRLTTAPRPTVKRFEKRVQPPPYSQLPTTTISETHGDIQALSGSSVELRLDVDQPLSRAELHWRSASDEQRPPVILHPANGQYLARWDIVESGTYRLVLESAATGFTNAFAPRHTVTAMADMPPRLAWLQPEQSLIAASAAELLDLRLQIVDELPLVKLEQWSRVAEEAWQQVALPLPNPSSAHSQIAEWSLDLMPLQAPVGAQVEIKVLATDRRGATRESDALRVLISSTSIDLEATPAELARLRLARHLADLTARLDGSESLAALANPAQAVANSESQRLQTAGQALHQELSRALPPLIEEAELALSVCEDRVAWKELHWVADILNRTLVAEVSSLSERPALPLNASEQQLQQLGQSLTVLVERMAALAEHLRTATSHDLARRHIESMARLAAAQAELGQAATVDTEALRRRQQVLNQQLRQLQASMLEATAEIQPMSQQRWRASAERVGTLVDQLESQMEDASSERLRRLMAATANSLDEGRLMARVDSLIYEQLKRAHRWLANQAESPADLLADLARALRNRGVQHPTTARVNAATTQTLTAKRRQIRTSAQGDPVWASDLGLTGRAIQSLWKETSSSSNSAQQLESLADALRVLETAAELRRAIAELRDLHACERWSHQDIEAFTESPRRWDSVLHQFERIAAASRHASVPPAWTRQVIGLRGHSAAVQAGSTITSRRSTRTQPKSVAPQLQELNVQLRDLQALLRPLEEQARAGLRAQSPTVVELAQQAAAETRAASQQTSDLGQQTLDQDAFHPKEQLRQLGQHAEQLQQPLQQLREALVDQAGAQDLLVRSQIDLAAKADTAIMMLDRIQEQTLQAETAIEQSLSSARATDLAASLIEAATAQADAADGLELVARYLGQATLPESLSGGTSSTTASAWQEAVLESAANYERAHELADLAASDPSEVLRELERRLKRDRPMQQELETITDTSAAEALVELERAAEQQARLAPDLARSDPDFRARQDLLAQDLRTAQTEASQLRTTFLHEARATAFASRATAQEREFEALEASLQEALAGDQRKASHQDWQGMLRTANSLQELFVRLQQASEQLAVQMKRHGKVAIHESGASVKNRRREMRDRQRRIFQQDIRNLQQTERGAQQRKRQADSALNKSRQQLAVETRKLEQLAAQVPAPQQPADSVPFLTQQTKVALLSETVEADAFLAEAYRQRVMSATTHVQQANRRQAVELVDVNPGAELSADLLSTLAERFKRLVQHLERWKSAEETAPRATLWAVNDAVEQQATIASQLAESSEKIGRARRHQRRLGNREASEQLSEFAQRLDTQLAEALAAAQQALRQAQASAEQAPDGSGRAATASTAAANQATGEAASAIAEAASQLRGLLQAPADDQESAPESTARASTVADQARSERPASASTLSPQQMAQLLDELDRQLNATPTKPDTRATPQLGPQDNNAHNPPSGQQALSETLAEAAQRMAVQLSQNRQAPASPSTTDLGLATEPYWADSRPQAPVVVETQTVRRQGQDWGELRRQRSEGTTESRFHALAPRYREQVEAYFKNLSIQSDETSDVR